MTLEVRQVGYRPGGTFRLHQIDFDVAAGQLVGILGPNGAGKSTLLSCIAQVPANMEGDIRWNSTLLKGYPISELAKARSVFTQKVEVSTDFSGEDIVMMGRYPHFRSRASYADQAHAGDAMMATETTHLARRSIRSMSGGEQQRVHLARASAQVWEGLEDATTPKLLLLDEPLNNLDIRHQHAILQFAREFSEAGNVVLMVMHDLNLAAMYAHRILMLCDGEQMAFGEPHHVLNETLLEHCYRCPVSVQAHPFHACPVVFFRNPASTLRKGT